MRPVIKRSVQRLYYSNDGGYMKRRLQDLLESNTIDQNDPLMKISHGSNGKSRDINAIYKDLDDISFKDKYKAELSITDGHNNMNKHARDIATGKPWTSDEDPMDTSLRMLLDVAPKSKGGHGSVSNLGFKSYNSTIREMNEPRSTRRSIRIRDRLEKAQDKVGIYQQDKKSAEDIEKKEASEFRALYAEKFTPIGSFEKLRSIADARIEESMKKGEFKSVKTLYGKETDVVNNHAHIDRTDYLLNNILVRQNIVPPWIEKQGSVDKDIEMFRKELKRKLEADILLRMQRKKLFSTGNSDLLEVFKSISTSSEQFLQNCFDTWAPSTKSFLKSNIPRLNSSLRSYNLQAPLPTQKLYLVEDRELERARKGVDLEELFKTEFEKQLIRKKPSVETNKSSSFSIFNLFKPY